GAPPLLHRFHARQMFEAAMAGATVAAQRLEAFLGTRHLQPQLRVLVVTAVAASLLVLGVRGLGFDLSGSAHTPVDPVFVLLWAIGCACAIGAAYQAKYHRLAALILMGGAGLVSCVTFV